MSDSTTWYLHPHPQPPSSPRSTALSIIDSDVSNYSPCSALWLFPPPLSGSHDLETFRLSLQGTLAVYPQLCGRLHIPPYDPDIARIDHTRRFGRVHLSWGEENDPGVSFTTCTSSHTISHYHQLAQDGVTSLKTPWELYPAFNDLPTLRDPEGRIKSATLVKLTTLADSALAVGIAFHHCLADTQTLMTFMRDWSDIHRQLGTSAPVSVPERPFQPLLLDSYAEGNINAPTEDAVIRDKALQLPQIRLDFWSGVAPSYIKSPTKPHPAIEQLDIDTGRQRGKRIPWEKWDASRPVKDVYVHFSSQEIHSIWRGSNAPQDVSRLDVLLAHIWGIITRARKVPGDDEVYLDMSIGLRPRFDPPLGDTFLGSPLVNFSTALTAAKLVNGALGDTASLIRSTVQKVNKDTLPALLHHFAFTLDPIREWNAFLGSHHLMVTSWLGTGSWDIDFGFGNGVDVSSGIPAMDGLVVIMDEKRTALSGDGMRPSRRWYDDGVRVRLCLLEEVMERVLADPKLRPTSV